MYIINERFRQFNDSFHYSMLVYVYILVRVVDVLSPFNVDFSAMTEPVIHKTALKLGKIKFRKLHVRISVQFSLLISAVVFFLRCLLQYMSIRVP